MRYHPKNSGEKSLGSILDEYLNSPPHDPLALEKRGVTDETVRAFANSVYEKSMEPMVMKPIPIPDPPAFRLDRFMKALHETQTTARDQEQTSRLLQQIEEIQALAIAL